VNDFLIYIGRIIIGVLMVWLGWYLFQKPRPKLKIIEYNNKYITVSKRWSNETKLVYVIHPRLHNAGTQATTILSIKVDIDDGKWIGTHTPRHDERDIGAGETRLVQLFSSHIDNGLILKTDSLPKEMKCRLEMNHTGRNKPLIDKMILKNQ